jgi:hypothetical protein
MTIAITTRPRMPQGVIGRVSLTRGGWSTGEMLRDLRALWAKQGLLNTTAIYPLAHRARSVGPKSRSRRFGNAQIDQRHARTPLAQLWPWLLFRRVSLHPSRSTLNSCSVSRIAWLFLFGVSLTAQIMSNKSDQPTCISSFHVIIPI